MVVADSVLPNLILLNFIQGYFNVSTHNRYIYLPIVPNVFCYVVKQMQSIIHRIELTLCERDRLDGWLGFVIYWNEW